MIVSLLSSNNGIFDFLEIEMNWNDDGGFDTCTCSSIITSH